MSVTLRTHEQGRELLVLIKALRGLEGQLRLVTGLMRAVRVQTEDAVQPPRNRLTHVDAVDQVLARAQDALSAVELRERLVGLRDELDSIPTLNSLRVTLNRRARERGWEQIRDGRVARWRASNACRGTSARRAQEVP